MSRVLGWIQNSGSFWESALGLDDISASPGLQRVPGAHTIASIHRVATGLLRKLYNVVSEALFANGAGNV